MIPCLFIAEASFRKEVNKIKKNVLQNINYVIYALFIIGTIITLVVIYKNIDTPLTFKFVIGYVFFILISFLYFVSVTILRMKNLKCLEIRKRLFNFIVWFIAFYTFNFILRLAFNYPSKGILGDISVALGMSIGIAFFDLVFSNKNKKI